MSNLHALPLHSKKSPRLLTFCTSIPFLFVYASYNAIFPPLAVAFAGYTRTHSTTTRRNAQCHLPWNPSFHPHTQTSHQTCVAHQSFSSLHGPPRVAQNARSRKSPLPPQREIAPLLFQSPIENI